MTHNPQFQPLKTQSEIDREQRIWRAKEAAMRVVESASIAIIFAGGILIAHGAGVW